jgi:hypothetical protein
VARLVTDVVGLDTEAAADQDCGTDNFPTGAALPTLASTALRTPAEPGAVVIALVEAAGRSGGREPPAWKPYKFASVTKSPTKTAVRIVAEAKPPPGPVRVLKASNAVITGGDPDVDVPEGAAVKRVWSCCGTADIAWDTFSCESAAVPTAWATAAFCAD